ncbi:hypothetical protein LCGC14_1048200 [marine sediment metagenome]|uniref:Uncharacterized protein n=1 Tax=marine sediment metagenome TaxID=412755 RepID=A0A0F9MU64_9ZZZZ
MELIPIEHNISEVVKSKLALARMYEDAGMKTKAREINKGCVVQICEENEIPIIQSGDYGDGYRMVGSGIIRNWEGLDWDMKRLKDLHTNIPTPILKKMAKVKDSYTLRIAFPIKVSVKDPVLLYELPFLDDAFIELARWE